MSLAVRKVKTINPKLTLRDFHNQRNKVLIQRDCGGVGDILMCRMMFEDFKRVMPDAEITFATPTNYHTILGDHPYIDKVVNSKDVNENEYGVCYNVSTTCIRYEMAIAPRADRHRSDIWANYCGVQLTKHNMHLHVDAKAEEQADTALKTWFGGKGPLVCFCPISTQVNKDLGKEQIDDAVKAMQEAGFKVFVLHVSKIQTHCPAIFGCSLQQWLGFIKMADYVVTVDTGSFHAAQGFNKPTVGIFAWSDGKVYGKYHEKFVLVQKHRDHTPGWTCGPCFNHPHCPLVPKEMGRKPCITKIQASDILEGLFALAGQYPTPALPERILQPSLIALGTNRKSDTLSLCTRNSAS